MKDDKSIEDYGYDYSGDELEKRGFTPEEIEKYFKKELAKRKYVFTDKMFKYLRTEKKKAYLKLQNLKSKLKLVEESYKLHLASKQNESGFVDLNLMKKNRDLEKKKIIMRFTETEKEFEFLFEDLVKASKSDFKEFDLETPLYDLSPSCPEGFTSL